MAWTPSGWQKQSLRHGEYKSDPNNVTLADGTTHWYAPVLDTPSEMHRLMEELRSNAFVAAHPVLQAAFAHHALTAIHPFADGNGRVARALASVFTYRVAGIPLVIFSDQQERYWDALAAADLGRITPFVTFMDERALDTMALVTDRLHRARKPLDMQVAGIRERFRAHGGRTHAEVQAVGDRLVQLTYQALSEELSRLALEPDALADFTYSSISDCTFWDQPYHLLNNANMLVLTINARAPFNVSVPTSVVVGLANDIENPYTYTAIDANRSTAQPLKLRLTDLHPATSAVGQAQLDAWAYRTLSTALDDVARALDQMREQQGYSKR